ncbi:PEP-CTERM system TPR-repeat protein PrsT [Aquincola sp. S2]|uniref:PEP-CTERM system TPR-repeat protein PrsT n=1 Tax=Pseudaquabacterium terrae TaxID=2732868 RepID=A0ABX2EE16_9BURK|nr:XrtA/PEP-CTERM system TPR-repeat protein PrsT [Aquabacterium terrae]NRF66858.1 PEP-CTERM system TPR-repeat protein PrsT [Aquabacterium terrae]
MGQEGQAARPALRRAGWAALALAAALAAGCGGKSEAELMTSAKAYLEKRDPKAATIQLKNLLEKNPQSAEARFLLGQALLDGGDPVGAEVELRRALEYRHPEAAVIPARARALLALGQPRKVIDDYGQTDLNDPKADVELQVALARAYATLGTNDEAQAAVDKALGMSAGHASAVVMDAKLKAVAGNVDGALAAIDGLLQRAPENTDALQFKADLLLHGKGDRPGALALYRKALAIRGDLVEAHGAVFSVLLADKDNAGAGKQLEELRKIRPTHPHTRYMEAQFAFASRDYKKAQEQLQALLRMAPDSVRVLQLAGAVELQQGALPQAETLLARAVQHAPGSVDARRLLAEVYLRSRQPAKALATLKPLLERKPSAEVLALAAQAYLLEGDAKAAEQMFVKAAQIKPDDKRLNAAVALSQLGRGNPDAAFGELQKLAAADEGRSVDMALISARIQRREFDGALKAIDALERKQADSPIPAVLRGRVLAMKKDFAGARKAFEAAVARDAKYLPAVAGLAALDLQDKQPAAAQQRFEAVLKLDPKNVPALLALAELKQRAGAGSADVGKLFADAVRVNPNDAQARLAQIDFLTRAQDAKGALSAAQAAAAALPTNLDILDRLGRAQLAAGDREQAKSSFAKIVSLRPDAAVGHLGLATTHMASGDADSAERSARKAIEKEPDSVAGHRMVIAIQLRQKQPQKAIETARQLQKRRPDDGVGFLAEGEIEASQKHWDPAIAAFRNALGKTDASTAATRLHAALLGSQRPPEAQRFADSWLKDHPTDAAFRLYLGDAALAMNDLPAAEARYQDVLQRQPDNAIALNNVAWLKMRQKKPGALEFAERAVAAAPNQPALMDTLAMVLSAERQHPRAIELQKQVVAQAPQVQGFRLNLAKIYLEAGDKKQARTELEPLVKLGKDFVGHAEVAQLVKKIEGG